MKSLADHGQLDVIVLADGGDCEAVLTQFARAGIDLNALGARLQDEGAASFGNPWHDLRAVIAAKGAVLQKAS